MKPKAFDNLPTTADGSTVVTLLRDPDGDEGSMFVSLVNRGANGRRIAVAKVDQPAEETGITFRSDPGPGVLEAGEPWWRRMWSSLLALVGGAAKKSEDFDETRAAREFWPTFWDATSILEQTLHEIMESDEPGRQERIDKALAQFSRFVSGVFEQVPAQKADRFARAIAAELEHARVIKAGDPATIAADDHTAGPTAITTGGSMDLEKMAEGAAAAAVKAAKAANPNMTPAELVQVSVAASTEVYKAAVMGPKQPAMPTDVVAMQLRESGAFNGSAPDPLAMTQAAMRAMSDTVKKSVEEALPSLIDASISKALQGTEQEPGLAAVVAKQQEILTAVAGRVQKIAAVPEAPRSGGEPANRVPTQKADDHGLAGSIFGNLPG